KENTHPCDRHQHPQRKAQNKNKKEAALQAPPTRHRPRKTQQEATECQTQNRDPWTEVKPPRHEANPDRADRHRQYDDQSGDREVGYSTWRRLDRRFHFTFFRAPAPRAGRGRARTKKKITVAPPTLR